MDMEPISPDPQRPDGTTGKTIAALILGISGVVLSCTFVLGLFGLVCGIVGLVLAIHERKDHPTGLATAAFVLSIVALALGALSTVCCVGCTGFYMLWDPTMYYPDMEWIPDAEYF